MPDPADVAQYQMEQLQAQIGVGFRAKVDDRLPFIGRCHNCDESIGSGQKFCDDDCKDDWKRRNPNR